MKPGAAFHRNAARHDGLCSYCIACNRARDAEKAAEREAAMPPKAQRDAARFWSKVAIGDPDSCWLWTGRVTNSGYGLFSIGNDAVTAHRYCFEVMRGQIPPGLVVRHACDVRLCQNPKHLLVGTWADNSRDAISRGRTLRGERHPYWGRRFPYKPRPNGAGERNGHAKLCSSQRDEIIRKHAGGALNGGVSCERLATEYGVSPSAIRALVKGKTWKHVTESL